MPIVLTAVLFYLLGETYLFRVEYDATAIYVYSPWRPNRTIPWTDVTTCLHWNYMYGGAYSVRTRGHGKVTLSDMFPGIDEFIALLKARQSPDDYAASVMLNRPFWRRWGDIFRR